MRWTFSNLMAYAIFCLWKKKEHGKKVQLQCVSGAHSGSDSQSSVFLQQQHLYIIKLGKSNLPLLHSASVFKWTWKRRRKLRIVGELLKT